MEKSDDQNQLVEAKFNLLKRIEEVMEKNHKNINRKIIAIENSEDQLKREIQNMTFTSEFISTAMMTSNLIISLRNIQQNLLDTITNIYSGKFSFHLLSPDQLKQELNVIAGQLPKDLSLPIDNYNLYEIYNLLQVRARIRNNYIIFEIKIPLISRDMFEVLEVIPVPYISESKEEISVVPVSRYIAINLKKDSLVPLTEKDLDLCTRRDPKIILCYHKSPIYYIKDDQSFCENLPFSRKCKTITRTCYNRWIELNKLNTYFYFCCNQCKVKLLCDDQVTAVQLTRSGLLNVNQGCIVKAADFFVYSHRQEFSEMNIRSDIRAPEISPINHIINISLPDRSLPNNTNDDIAHNLQLQMIKEQIEIMKNTEPLAQRVSYHDVHHYAAIYVLFAVVAVGALAYSWRRCRRTAPGAPAEAGVSVPMAVQETSSPEVLPSVSVQCSECVMGNQCQSVSANDFSKKSARVFKQNRSTSPVLRSVYAIPNQCA